MGEPFRPLRLEQSDMRGRLGGRGVSHQLYDTYGTFHLGTRKSLPLETVHASYNGAGIQPIK